MELSYIEDIADVLRMNREKKEKGAVVFLGAGASISAGIPLANEIIEDVIDQRQWYWF